MSAVKFFGENHLHLSNVVAARVGRGLRELPSIRGYAESMVIIWRPGGSYMQLLTDRLGTAANTAASHE